MKALVLDAEGRTANIQDLMEPSPDPHEVLVQVKAISLNPIDPLYVAHPLASSGRTIGSDFAGIVTALGSSVPVSCGLQPGDRVAGFLQGACSVNDRPGAFAEYLTVDWDLVWKVPDDVQIEEAAATSLVALTAAQGIWYRLMLEAPFWYGKHRPSDHLPSPVDGAETLNFFIYGASTSVALYAAQMIRLSARSSGHKIRLFGAAGRHNWDMLRSEPYGYEHLVDYRDADWPQQARDISGGNGMHYAYDCISEGDSVLRVSSILQTDGRMAIVRSKAGGAWNADKLSVDPIYGAVWEGLGKEVQYQGFTVKESPAARSFAVEFYRWLSREASKALKLNRIRVMPGGLERVVTDGFRLLGAGSMAERETGTNEEWMKPVSAEKLVYKL
jgi:NADPH:quinone reductase-like Zn-dependent oxidoreductase